MRPLPLAAFASAALLAALGACGDDDNSPNLGVDAGSEASTTTPDGGGAFVQRGQIVRATAVETVVPGATITVGDKSVTSDETGGYTIEVPEGAPYQMRVSAPSYYTLVEQEWTVRGPSPFDRGQTQLLATTLANILTAGLTDRDMAKGLLVVKVTPLAPCDSEEGSTVTLDPPGDAKVQYFDGQFPSPDKTSIAKGTAFSAVFYNVEPGVPLTVRVDSPRCEALAFPVEQGGVAYGGTQKVEPGEALSYLRLFLGPVKASDAGADADADAE